MDTRLEQLTARLEENQIRLENAERKMEQAEAQMKRTTRRARATGGLALAALVGVSLIGTHSGALAQASVITLDSLLARIIVLEAKTAPISVSGKDLTVTGVNVHIVSGSGLTDDGTGGERAGATLTGLGNLIIGYNGSRDMDGRGGSHNLVLGDRNNYASYGGIVAGYQNAATGVYASVTGGRENTASGRFASVTGGYKNTAGGSGSTSNGVEATTVSGGTNNTAVVQYAAEPLGGSLTSLQTSVNNLQNTIIGTSVTQSLITARICAVEAKTAAITISNDPFVDGTNNLMTFNGVNVRIVNGLGDTETQNGLGNLIVGYNETRGSIGNLRTGSHNIVTGELNNFSSSGGFLGGYANTLSGSEGFVVGYDNVVSGQYASVTAGYSNKASGQCSSISGGWFNGATGGCASVTGGSGNTASGSLSSISGGQNLTIIPSGDWAAGTYLTHYSH